MTNHQNAVAIAVLIWGTSALGFPAIGGRHVPNKECPKRWGEPGKPLVRNAKAAEAIFLAVELDFYPEADRAEYPAVDAVEEDSYWSVFRYRPNVKNSDGSITTTMGGGQLSFRIAKCDGAISEV